MILSHEQAEELASIHNVNLADFDAANAIGKAMRANVKQPETVSQLFDLHDYCSIMAKITYAIRASRKEAATR